MHSFDHASSLGRELTDDRRQHVLDSEDGVLRYLNAGRGAVFVNDRRRKRALSPLRLARLLCRWKPEYTRRTLARIGRVSEHEIRTTIERVPDEFMSDLAKEFAFLGRHDRQAGAIAEHSMTTLYLAWQHPPTRRWFPVGRLVHHQSPDVFEFVYVQGANEAKNLAGFRPIPDFPSLSQRYRASELFPTFRNRVMNSNRIDRWTYLSHLGLHAGRCDELAELSVSGGRSHSDSFETFPALEPDAQGKLRTRLMLRGLRHTNPHAIEAIETLRAGDELRIAVDLNIPATNHTILVYTRDYHVLGWLPQYVAEAICRNCEWRISDARVAVAQVNRIAPLSDRLLLDFSGRLSAGISPMRDLAQFQPVPEAAESNSDQAVDDLVR